MLGLQSSLSLLFLSTVSATPTPSLLQASTHILSQRRDETTSAVKPLSWWSSQNRTVSTVVIVGGILAAIVFILVVAWIGNRYHQASNKRLNAASDRFWMKKPATQAELIQCWEAYGQRDAMGRPRQATQEELTQLWAAHGADVRRSRFDAEEDTKGGGGG